MQNKRIMLIEGLTNSDFYRGEYKWAKTKREMKGQKVQSVNLRNQAGSPMCLLQKKILPLMNRR